MKLNLASLYIFGYLIYLRINSGDFHFDYIFFEIWQLQNSQNTQVFANLTYERLFFQIGNLRNFWNTSRPAPKIQCQGEDRL
jgi:hypothetical protein